MKGDEYFVQAYFAVSRVTKELTLNTGDIGQLDALV